MAILLDEDLKIKLPTMHKVEQIFEKKKLNNVKKTVKYELNKDEIKERILPGQKIAVAVGSRGIKNLFTIVKTIVDELKNMGAEPYILSAMGSHGSGTEEGQRKVLESYNITEEKLDVEIVTTVDVEKIGETSKGFSVFFDKSALSADLIIPVNRVKLHTDFVGDLQSGLCKMLVIGLGNHIGCSSIHEENPEDFAEILEEATQIIISKANVSFGVAIVENAYDETLKIEAILSEKMIEREKELVIYAKGKMPKLMIPEIDILIVEEIGKDISGAGYDPNIIGRSSILKEFALEVPSIKRMILLDISEASHGNGIGIGMFDIVLKKAFDKLDLESMYANSIACKAIEDVRIPLIAMNEEEAIKIAIKVTREIDRNNLKIVKIKNTLELKNIYVSDALLNEVKNNKYLKLVDE